MNKRLIKKAYINRAFLVAYSFLGLLLIAGGMGLMTWASFFTVLFLAGSFWVAIKPIDKRK